MSEGREPVRTATGATVGVTVILTAFFFIARDLGVDFPQDTQAALTGAVVVITAFLANEWARLRSTSYASPRLEAGTDVTVTDADNNALEVVKV